MTADMLDQIAARSTAEGETIHNEPFAVQPRMVAEAIRVADAMGQEWNRKHGVSAIV
jgi:glycerol dehydrogenase